MKYKYVFLVTMLLISNYVMSQHIISGKVKDGQKNDMSFVNVVLLHPENLNLIKGTITDDRGVFEIHDVPNGDYILSLTFLGFETKTIPVEVNKPTDIGTIIINDQAESLDVVMVQAKRKLIQRKIDRLVFDVEHSIQSSGGDALDVLKVTPGVRVQNDKIRMIGKSKLSVMVDDKWIKLSDEDLSNYLKSIASEDIKHIEVITTPPAKYEAAGNSGFINIRLKKAKRNAWNALVRVGYWQRTHPNGSTGANFNYNKNKLSIASSVFYRDGIYRQEQDDYAYFPDGIWYTRSPFKANIQGMNTRIDLQYQISDNYTMGAQYVWNRTAYDVQDDPYMPVFDYESNEIMRALRSRGTMDFSPAINAVNINNEVRLDTLGRKLSVHIDYFTYKNPDTRTYSGVSTIVEPAREQFYSGVNKNDQAVTNISGTIDFDFPMDWASLSMGGKVTRSTSKNDISFFNSGFVDYPVTNFSLSKNDFKYIENIQAIYLSVQKPISDKWETQMGIRMEATQSQSSSDNLDFSEKNDYIKVFPTFYLSYTPSESSTWIFSYSKRIDRPQFFDLNPNIYFVNPFQIIDGNPFLQPAFVDNFELGHTYKNWSSKIYYSDERNQFGQVPLPDPATNFIQFTNKNYIYTRRLGVSTNFVLDLSDWWTSNNSLDANYTTSAFTLPVAQDKLKGVQSSISTSHDFVLRKNKTLLLNINYMYNFPSVDGIFDNKAVSSLSGSLHYLLLDKQLRLTLRANDIFGTQATRQSSTINGVYQEARYEYDSQSFAISISYKFGNKDIRAKRHTTGNQDERNRTGN